MWVPPRAVRSLTADRYLEFRPDEKVTTAFLPTIPMRRTSTRRTASTRRKAGVGSRRTSPIREFFMLDPGSHLWSGAELYARALRGLLGPEQFKEVARRLTINQADGPGGRWYWEQQPARRGRYEDAVPYVDLESASRMQPRDPVPLLGSTRGQARVHGRVAVEGCRRHPDPLDQQVGQVSFEPDGGVSTNAKPSSTTAS